MVLEFKVYVYSIIDDLSLVFSTSTLMNPKGVIAVNSSDEATIMCCPAEMQDKRSLGLVQVWNLDDIKDECLTISAHDSTLGTLELNFQGTLMASASEKGTVIRIFDTKRGSLIQEFQRGTESAVIFSIDFHYSNDWLSCISDSGTLHIFNLVTVTNQKKGMSPTKTNRKITKNTKGGRNSTKNPKSRYFCFLNF